AQPARPKFDVASVKASNVRGMRFVRPTPGRLLADAPVKMLMQNAYTLQPFQVVGGPAWIDSENYQIEGKTGSSASPAQLFVMLHSLCAVPSQLKVHRHRPPLPFYTLVAAKGGLKLPAPKADSCSPPPPDAPPEWAGGRIAPPGGPEPPLPRCGDVRVML